MGSIHNSSYWKQKHYVGIGPSAHSFNGKTRQWNVSNNVKYIKGAESNNWDFEMETLDDNSKFNEYILTSLRTSWGVDLNYIKLNFEPNFVSHFIKNIEPFLEKYQVEESNNIYTLTEEGKLLADYIASELFVIDN